MWLARKPYWIKIYCLLVWPLSAYHNLSQRLVSGSAQHTSGVSVKQPQLMHFDLSYLSLTGVLPNKWMPCVVTHCRLAYWTLAETMRLGDFLS